MSLTIRSPASSSYHISALCVILTACSLVACCCERRPVTPGDRRLGNDFVRHGRGFGNCPVPRVVSASRFTGDQYEDMRNGGHPAVAAVCSRPCATRNKKSTAGPTWLRHSTRPCRPDAAVITRLNATPPAPGGGVDKGRQSGEANGTQHACHN